MAWFIAFAVLILAVFATGFRKTAFGLVAIALALGGWLFVYNREAEQLALTRIPASELILENVTFNPYVGGYKLAGRIRNSSAKFSVKEIDFVVTVQECTGAAAAEQCVTLGETSEILNLNVPPGATRNFEESVRFSGSDRKLKGRLKWSYSISRIRAG